VNVFNGQSCIENCNLIDVIVFENMLYEILHFVWIFGVPCWESIGNKRQHVVKMPICYKNMAQILKGKESTKLP
jgi:hypothetical protein